VRGLLVAFAVVVVILLIAPAALASRSEKEEEFEFHIGDKFLAKFGLGGASVAQADNGDKIYIVGSGEFEVDEREAEGRGTFQHFSSTGTLIASGTWKATRGFMAFRRSSKLSFEISKNFLSTTCGNGSFGFPDRSAITPMTNGSWIFFCAP